MRTALSAEEPEGFVIPLSAEEKKAIEAAANRIGMTVEVWCMQALKLAPLFNFPDVDLNEAITLPTSAGEIVKVTGLVESVRAYARIKLTTMAKMALE